MIRRLRRWLASLGRRVELAGVTEIPSSRIYIVPTSVGIALGVLGVGLLVAANNYGANLVFALAFWLAGIGTSALLRNYRNLLGLRLALLAPAPVFAGEPVRWRLRLEDCLGRHRWQLELHGRDAKVELDVPAAGGAEAVIEGGTKRRGRLAPGEWRLVSRFPLGVSRAWSWILPRAEAIVYPRPAAVAASPAGEREGDAAGVIALGEEEWYGLRDYRPGDATRRIDWKGAARALAVPVKEFRAQSYAGLWYDLASAGGGDVEERLSRICRALLDAEAAGQPYGLRLPEGQWGPALGAEHARRCLTALALHAP